jgi:23S rRNA pseudouridine955/2504/2580 synthase
MAYVQHIVISASEAGQRVDNYLIRKLKGVPKSRLYKALRKGEVRVNKKRVKAPYKLCAGDSLRVPPIRQGEQKPPFSPTEQLSQYLESEVIWQNSGLLIVNKPSGMPVHGGSNISAGLIEMLRSIYPQWVDLELVHRLDRDTSGCIMLAKKRSALRSMHELWRQGKVDKRYLAFVRGRWPAKQTVIDLPLQKNVLESGERRVRVDPEGKPSKTSVRVFRYYQHGTLLQVSPITGRTHQIRVHLAAKGYPIAGDDKYGDDKFNRLMASYGLKRLLLHSASLSFQDPITDSPSSICATVDFMSQLRG